MTERVNLCDFFVYGNVVKCRSDSSLAHFLWLFLCSPIIVNLSLLLACGKFHLLCKDLESSSLLCRWGRIAASFRVGLSYLSTNIPQILRWVCSRCGPLLSFETFAWIRRIVCISAISNDLLLFLSIFLRNLFDLGEILLRSVLLRLQSNWKDFPSTWSGIWQ